MPHTIQGQPGASSDWSVTGSRPANFVEPVQRRKAWRATLTVSAALFGGHMCSNVHCLSVTHAQQGPSVRADGFACLLGRRLFGTAQR
jgi:hypothetical protein